MVDARISSAASAYRDASKVAERILQDTKAQSAPSLSETKGPSFLELVGSSLKSSAAAGYNSEAVATRALAGKADVTDVVTAVANAELALNTVVAVRDRVISAYQDIIKMPI